MTISRSITMNVQEKSGAVLTCGHDDSVSLILQESITDEIIVRFTAFHVPKLRELVRKIEQMQAELDL